MRLLVQGTGQPAFEMAKTFLTAISPRVGGAFHAINTSGDANAALHPNRLFSTQGGVRDRFVPSLAALWLSLAAPPPKCFPGLGRMLARSALVRWQFR